MSYFIRKRFVFNVVLVVLCASMITVKSEEDCDVGVENMLETIMSPYQPPSIQVQALRRDILRRLRDALQNEANEEDLYQPKRSYSSLARWNNLPNKKSLESLARGGYLRPRAVDSDPNLKRSIANLAKNGQLPDIYQTDEMEKRGIQSLARNGDLHYKREMQDYLDDLYDKRNIGSLARNYNFPSTNYGKRFFYEFNPNTDDKRNIASLAREGMKINGKRNAAALLRQDSYLNEVKNDEAMSHTQKPDGDVDAEKRNIASIKAQYKSQFKRSADIKNEKREKRNVDYYDMISDEYPSPVYQNQNVFDYEELLKELSGEYQNPEKRFLGRLPQMGKAKTTPSPKTRFH